MMRSQRGCTLIEALMACVLLGIVAATTARWLSGPARSDSVSDIASAPMLPQDILQYVRAADIDELINHGERSVQLNFPPESDDNQCQQLQLRPLARSDGSVRGVWFEVSGVDGAGLVWIPLPVAEHSDDP
ncbi:MAG: prepilin-type N-terminal cleavage/methylation domain-containing protein [Planctomycetota bacterium]